MGYESAELAKTAINLYLCAAVTYANTLSNLCEAIHADWWEIMPALRLDARIGPSAYIRPGLGIAGGNLERDLVALRDLCQSKGVDPSFIETIIDSNARRHEWAHARLREQLFGEVSHPVVAVWGLAYKKNTRSMKNSMALRVLRDLVGRAEVRAYDPVVTVADIDAPVKVVGDRDEALVGADCLLIMTDWDEFALLRRNALETMRRRVVIDCVGVVDAALSDLSDVRYLSMGRGGRP
jgi:UDPglucose 6-dehydrogenase